MARRTFTPTTWALVFLIDILLGRPAK